MRYFDHKKWEKKIQEVCFEDKTNVTVFHIYADTYRLQ
jgi:hypothetical protein